MNKADAQSYTAHIGADNSVVIVPHYWKAGYTASHKATEAEAVQHLSQTLKRLSLQYAVDAQAAIAKVRELRGDDTPADEAPDGFRPEQVQQVKEAMNLHSRDVGLFQTFAVCNCGKFKGSVQGFNEHRALKVLEVIEGVTGNA